MKKVLLLGSLLIVGASLVSAQNRTLVIAGRDGPTDTGLFNDVITRFVKPALAKDGIDVRFTPLGDYDKTLTNQLSAGTAADVFYLPDNTAEGLVKSGKVLALNGLVNTGDFVSSLNSIYRFNNKTYGVVKDFNTLALYFNKDLFDQAKVAYPRDTDTWAEYERKITAVQKALGQGYYGTCTPPDYGRFGAFAAATGWKPTQKLSDARFVRAFDFYTGLERKNVGAQPSAINAGWGGDCLKSGKVATAFEGAWALGFLRDNAPNLQYGTVLPPRDATTKRSGNLLFTVAWAINADTKMRDAAVKALNILTSKEAQEYVLQSGLALPSRKALQTDPYFKKAGAEPAANATVFRGATAGYTQPFTLPPAYTDAINTALKAVMDGQATRDQALAQAQAKIDAIK